MPGRKKALYGDSRQHRENHRVCQCPPTLIKNPFYIQLVFSLLQVRDGAGIAKGMAWDLEAFTGTSKLPLYPGNPAFQAD